MSLLARPVQRVRRFTQGAALLAQLVVLVLAWAGPVPIGHDHETLAASGRELPELATHLAAFHDSLSTDPFPGWHLHWVWFGDENGGLLNASRAVAGDPNLSVSDLPSEPFHLAWGNHGLEDAVLPLADGFAERRSTPSFFGTFSSRRSLPERLGVVRC